MCSSDLLDQSRAQGGCVPAPLEEELQAQPVGHDQHGPAGVLAQAPGAGGPAGLVVGQGPRRKNPAGIVRI